MLDLKFVGTGGAFDIEYGNSAAILTLHNRKILIDCGYTTYSDLRHKSLVDVPEAVLITHLHDDHVGSLSTLLYHRFFITQKPLTLYFSTEIFREQLYNFLVPMMQHPEQFCHLEPLTSLAGAHAMDTTGLHFPGMTSYAFVFEEDGKSIAYSGDLGDSDVLFSYLQTHKLQPEVVYHDINFNPQVKVHAYYLALAAHITSFNIVGYHCDPTQNPADNSIPLAHQLSQYLL